MRDLCRRAEASTYLSGALGRNYIRETIFDACGIRVRYQDYQHPSYPQTGQSRFEPFMGVIDLLVNCGPDSLRILMQGQEMISLIR